MLLIVPRTEKSHKKQGARVPTSAMGSCQEVSTALNFSTLNRAGERHAISELKTSQAVLKIVSTFH